MATLTAAERRAKDDRKWEDGRRAERTTLCPSCGSVAGKKCRTHGGTRAKTRPHQTRVRRMLTAEKIGARPLDPSTDLGALFDIDLVTATKEHG